MLMSFLSDDVFGSLNIDSSCSLSILQRKSIWSGFTGALEGRFLTGSTVLVALLIGFNRFIALGVAVRDEGCVKDFFNLTFGPSFVGLGGRGGGREGRRG